MVMCNRHRNGEAYAAYIRDAMETPYMIGSFWCNPVDSNPGFKKSGVKQGFFGDNLAPRPGLYQAVRELNRYREEITPAP